MIYHVYANQSNAGDWLSARGIQSLLAPRAVVELFCDTPFVPRTMEVLRQATPDDFIIIGGGGLFMDYFVPFWEAFRELAPRVPFAIWGAGACDMKREQSRPPQALISEIIGQSKLCVVRDELTRQIFAGCKLPPPVVCPVFAALSPTAGETRRLLHVDHYNNVGPAIYERMVAIAEEFAERTGRSCRQTNNLLSAGHRGQLQKILDLYISSDLVLTSRLHGCILALALGRRVLAVSGDHKVESFMHAAGLADWVCDLDDVELLPSRLEKLPQQQLPVEFIAAGRRQNQRVAEQIIAMLPPERIQSEEHKGVTA